jgi:FAD/FMN-containing dehydrogenase
MNKILDFDESYGIVTSEAGVILRNLQNYTIERGYEVPLDMGSKDSCQIGGSLANNAGGLKVIRHNSMHANTIGMKMVLADGTILDNMTTLRKDNTGYDLKQLFIGSEGTLGMITECSILCPPYPTKKHVSMVTCRTFEDVLKLLHKTKAVLGDILYSFEVMDKGSMELVLD